MRTISRDDRNTISSENGGSLATELSAAIWRTLVAGFSRTSSPRSWAPVHGGSEEQLGARSAPFRFLAYDPRAVTFGSCTTFLPLGTAAQYPGDGVRQ